MTHLVRTDTLVGIGTLGIKRIKMLHLYFYAHALNFIKY